MVCKDPETVQLMEVGAGIREKYLAQSQVVPLPFLYEGLDICNQADIQFRASRNQRLTIELALVKLANLSAGQKKKQLTEPKAVAESEPDLPVKSAVKTEAVAAKPEMVPAKPEKDTDKDASRENGNGASRTVWKPSISIKAVIKPK